ncbi:MAG: hypothetical protein MUC78_00305 [Bacteroidales bacterium]|nr:hypothetical protein [Bacteroidales bacterium]
MRKIVLLFTLITGMLAWQCSRNVGDTSLKSSLDESSVKINKAMTVISDTRGFQLMTLSDLTKSGDGYSDSINLDLIAGIYDFKPETYWCHHDMRPRWKFEKTGESEMLVVNIPQKMIFHPRYLYSTNPEEGLAENDFTISASEYHNYFSYFRRYDYRLMAGFTVDEEDAGTLEVTAAGSSFADRSYASEYHFTDEYSVMVSYERGDTSISSFTLNEGEEILLGEETVFIWKDFRKSERKYTLTIGDIDIVKSTGIDSIQVFLNGVLQSTAAVKITDEDETEGSVCHHRDILLTFDDGTSVKLSELISPALETLGTLITPMREMYFAKHIADYIAFSVYYQKL